MYDMKPAYDNWKLQEEAVKKLHDAIDEYANLVFDEWRWIRGCTAEAAYSVVVDRFKPLAEDGIQDHLNKLYREKVM